MREIKWVAPRLRRSRIYLESSGTSLERIRRDWGAGVS